MKITSVGVFGGWEKAVCHVDAAFALFGVGGEMGRSDTNEALDEGSLAAWQ